MSYRLEKTALGEEWDIFVKTSQNGTLFSYSDYLKSIPYKSVAYYCYKKWELRAAVILLETDNQQSTRLYGLVPHNGIIFGILTNNQNIAQQHSERFRISEFIANQLPKLYQNVELSQDPSYQDLRPFLWVNYGKDAPKYQVTNHYTSYLSIKDFSSGASIEDSEIYKNLSSSRRQEIRYAKKKEVATYEELNINLFTEMYKKMMLAQEIMTTVELKKEIEEIKQLILNLSEVGLGRMFISCTKSGNMGSIAFFGIDHKRGYFLFGANDPEMRDEHTGTAVLWDSFCFLSQDGIFEIDLEGINSPTRGWFKLSFGGTISPYYHLSYSRA